QGQPHVTDFGLAKRVEGDSALTQSGAIVGTPSYMAPEQAAGQKRLTTAADVYSLGAILYELLTGRPPFQALTPLDMLVQVRSQEPLRPRSLDPRCNRDLETICLKCLEKDSQRRYGSAEALADDLERWLASEPIHARPVSAWEQLVKWAKRRPASAALLVGVGGFVASGLGVVDWGWKQAETAGRAAAERAVGEAEARRKAEEKEKQARRHAQLIEAHLTLERGTNRLDRGDLGPGMLWLVRGLEVAPEDAGDLKRSLRTLLGGWTQEYHLLKGVLRHEGRVRSAVYSPDGQTILTGSGDGTVQQWDVATGKPRGEPLRLPGKKVAVAFPPEGRTFLAIEWKDFRGINDTTAQPCGLATGKR